MDNQELIKVINGLKEEKYIYNDADLCRKLECSKAFLSELKAGKRPIFFDMAIKKPPPLPRRRGKTLKN